MNLESRPTADKNNQKYPTWLWLVVSILVIIIIFNSFSNITHKEPKNNKEYFIQKKPCIRSKNLFPF